MHSFSLCMLIRNPQSLMDYSCRTFTEFFSNVSQFNSDLQYDVHDNFLFVYLISVIVHTCPAAIEHCDRNSHNDSTKRLQHYTHKHVYDYFLLSLSLAQKKRDKIIINPYHTLINQISENVDTLYFILKMSGKISVLSTSCKIHM